jgi:hypothetical protein
MGWIGDDFGVILLKFVKKEGFLGYFKKKMKKDLVM